MMVTSVENIGADTDREAENHYVETIFTGPRAFEALSCEPGASNDCEWCVYTTRYFYTRQIYGR